MVFVEAQNAIPQWTVLCCSYIKFDAVSPCNLTLYTTSQICMQCLTVLIYLLVAVESMSKNPQSALQYQYMWQSFESDYPAFWFLPPSRIENLWTPQWARFWYLPKMKLSFFVVWATILHLSSSMPGGLQWMFTWSGLFLGIMLDMHLCGDSTYTAKLRRPAALASYVSFVIKFFAIHLTMGLAQWGNFW